MDSSSAAEDARKQPQLAAAWFEPGGAKRGLSETLRRGPVFASPAFMSDVSARLVLACLLSLVAGSWGISAEVNASMASACWHEEGDAGIGLLSLRVRKAGGIKKQLPEQKIQEAFENCDALTTSYPKQFLLDTLIGVLVMAALHCLLHPLFQDVSARPADAKPRLDLLDNAKFWMLTIICATGLLLTNLCGVTIIGTDTK